MNYSLVVGRDKSHTREYFGKYGEAKIITASEFFDKVRFLYFLQDNDKVKDDKLSLLMAYSLLAQKNDLPLFFAENLNSLYSSIFHGVSTPKEIINLFKEKSIPIPQELLLCEAIDHELDKRKSVNNVTSLYYSLKIIKEKKLLPPSFVNVTKVLLLHLVDLTNLEVEIIKSLAKLGIKFEIIMPFDFEKRGINLGVDYIAKLFEEELDNENIELVFEEIANDNELSLLCKNIFKDNAFLELSSESISLVEESSQIGEAKEIAKKIAAIKENNNHDTIAIAARTMDNRTKIYKETIESFGIPIRDRKGIVLNKTKAGSLLDLIFSSIINNLVKKDLLSLLSHPLFSLKIDDENKLNTHIKIINNLKINDFITQKSSNRYEEPLNEYAKLNMENISFHEEILYLQEKIKSIFDIAENFKSNNKIDNFIKKLTKIVHHYFIKNDDSVISLHEALNEISRYKDLPSHEVSFKDFCYFINSYLNKITIPRKDYEDENAVELLLLPEVLGRNFDHVFIVDMALGRIPQTISSDPFFGDDKRVLVNKITKKQILKIFFDDPFEPSLTPPRQALEPFWFASTLMAAKKSICFSFSKMDYEGKEQTQSDFFLWLKKHIQIKNIKETIPYQSNYEEIFNATFVDKDIALAHNQRNIYLKSNLCDSYSFKIDTKYISKAFKGKLEQKPKKPLTPTFIESFSKCRFAGYLNRILKIDEEKEKIDLENKITGEIAHKTLEIFFNKKIYNLSEEDLKKEIKNTLEEVTKSYLQKNFVSSKEIFFCYMEWLSELLYDLIYKLLKNESDDNHYIGREISFGIGKDKKKAVKIQTKSGYYLVGGVIDKVDKIGNTYLITDYKLSSINNIKILLQKNYLFSKHFQMPIYIRLIGENYNNKEVSFLFASIKDADLLSEVNQWNQKEIYERIFNDERDDSLANAIDTIFLPIKHGSIPAISAEHCSTCQYNYVCRV